MRILWNVTRGLLKRSVILSSKATSLDILHHKEMTKSETKLIFRHNKAAFMNNLITTDRWSLEQVLWHSHDHSVYTL